MHFQLMIFLDLVKFSSVFFFFLLTEVGKTHSNLDDVGKTNVEQFLSIFVS